MSFHSTFYEIVDFALNKRLVADLVKKFGYIPQEGYLHLAEPALDAIKDAGICMELNTSGLRRTCREVYPSQVIVEAMRQREIPITLGSDAHKPEETGYAFDAAVASALQAGYTDIQRFMGRERFSIPITEAIHISS